jgi:hypothetical protein
LRLLVLGSMMLTMLLGMAPSWCPADNDGITRKHHPWGRFEPGAWKIVRATTETTDPNGTTLSTTETRTTLQGVAADGISLLIEVAVEVGGKEFDAQPQVVKQGFEGELPVASNSAKYLGLGQVVIQGRKIDCRIEQVESKDAVSKTVTKIYYSDTVEPYVLRRESVRTDPDGKTLLSETTVEVIALDVPTKVFNDIRNSAHVKAVSKTPRGSTVTLAAMSADVPGGVIHSTLKETDSQGRLVRQSSLELLDYGLDANDDRGGLFRHRHIGRFRKLHRFSTH